MNNRRRLVFVITTTVSVPQIMAAQPNKQPVVIGWLSTVSRESGAAELSAVKEGLAAFGWKQGSQVVFEEHWADGHANRIPALVKELSASKPTLIVAAGQRAARDASKLAPNIPIVTVGATDPVAAGLAVSLARPGGMVTGVTGLALDLTEKHLELLLAAAPRTKRVGFMGYSRNPSQPSILEAARRTAAQHRVEARFAEAGTPEEIEPALSQLAKEGVQALVLLWGVLLTLERQLILDFALAQRWPVVGRVDFVQSGALVGYSSDNLAQYRRAAYFVDRILKGAKPSDLPIEQPTTFDLVVNMKTAKALGLTMPPEIMVQATRVIQ